MLDILRRLWPGKPKRPFHLFQVEPTMRCNLKCTMCPWPEFRASQADMAWATFQRLVPHLPLAQELDLTGGGESLLHPRLLDMVQSGKEAGCSVGFSTNATLLTPEISATLVETGLDWIAYSIDGATASTYESIRQGAHFQAVLGHLQAMQEAKRVRQSQTPRTVIFFVMMRQNVQELPQMVELAHRLGVDQVVAKNLDVILKEGDAEKAIFGDYTPPSEVGHVLDEARGLAARYHLPLRVYSLQPQEAVVCEQDPLSSLFVNWQGDVSPCITLAYAQRQFFGGEWRAVQRRRWGNVNQEELPAIWQRAEYQEFRGVFQARRRAWVGTALEAVTEGVHNGDGLAMPPAPEGCRTCSYLYGV